MKNVKNIMSMVTQDCEPTGAQLVTRWPRWKLAWLMLKYIRLAFF